MWDQSSDTRSYLSSSVSCPKSAGYSIDQNSQMSNAFSSKVILPPISQSENLSGVNQPVVYNDPRSCVSAVNAKTGTALFSLEPIAGFTEYRPIAPSRSSGGIISGKNASVNSKKQNGKYQSRSVSPTLKQSPDAERKFIEDKLETDQINYGALNGMVASSLLNIASGNSECAAEGCLCNDSPVNRALIVQQLAVKTKSLGRFNKIAYPDLRGHESPVKLEPLYERKVGIQRAKILSDIERFINTEQLINRVVYDLDTIIAQAGKTFMGKYSSLTNDDENK